jgi:hypothetical protein
VLLPGLIDVDSLRGVAGLTDIRSAGLPAIGPAGPHTRIPGMPSEAIVTDPGQVTGFSGPHNPRVRSGWVLGSTTIS